MSGPIILVTAELSHQEDLWVAKATADRDYIATGLTKDEAKQNFITLWYEESPYQDVLDENVDWVEQSASA